MTWIEELQLKLGSGSRDGSPIISIDEIDPAHLAVVLNSTIFGEVIPPQPIRTGDTPVVPAVLASNLEYQPPLFGPNSESRARAIDQIYGALGQLAAAGFVTRDESDNYFVNDAQAVAMNSWLLTLE